jgi:hypothetical protein
MARTGLRMMPTSPSSPLKFRTAGFPRYGFKAGLSGGAFPHGVHVSRRMVCVHPSCPPLANRESPFCAGGVARMSTTVRAAVPLYPRGPRSGPGCAIPVHHHLIGPIRPTRRHSATSPLGGLYALPSLCLSASATREWFRAFTARSFSTCRPLRPRGARRGLSPNCGPDDTGLRLFRTSSALPSAPTIRFQWVPRFRGFSGSHVLRPVELLASLADPTGSPQPQRRVHPGFRRVGHPSRRRI